MSNLSSALIPYQKINDGFIKGINSVEQLKNLHIPNILISFLADDYVEITKLDCSKQSAHKINTFADDYLNKRSQFIDRYDLELYRDQETGRIELIGGVYKKTDAIDSGFRDDICMAFIVCLYNKRARTHLVEKLGLALISTAKIYDLNKINEISKHKIWEYVKITGEIKSTTIENNNKQIEIPYIEATNIEPSTKQAIDELIKC